MRSSRRTTLAPAGLAALVLLFSGPASAYPEFEEYIETTSGRNVNCGFCHSHPDGPEGVKAGQIGSLTPEQLDQLNRARTAFEPGQEVDSPILNDFGDHLIQVVGKKQFLALKASPERLAGLLGTSDLDGDGISDAEEYRDGTFPLNRHHGDPWKLFVNNLVDNRFHLLMLMLATIAGIYGLTHMLSWFGAEAEKALAMADDDTDQG